MLHSHLRRMGSAKALAGFIFINMNRLSGTISSLSPWCILLFSWCPHPGMGIEQLGLSGALGARLSRVLFHNLLYPSLGFAPLAGAASAFGDARGLGGCQTPQWPWELPGSVLSPVLSPGSSAGRALPGPAERALPSAITALECTFL